MLEACQLGEIDIVVTDDGQLSNLDGKTDFATVNRRLSEIEKELATLNQLWEQAASELAYYEAE